jgi:hypothetical protein
MSKTPEQQWMGKVARVPCVICTRMGLGESPSVVHHMKFGTGACDRASDFLTIALCPPHHDKSPDSVHVLKERGIYLRYKCSELDLLADTIRAASRLK